jgi:hypothetical protein
LLSLCVECYKSKYLLDYYEEFIKTICLLPASFKFLAWLTSVLNLEATFSSETAADFHLTTRCYIPEDKTLHLFYSLFLLWLTRFGIWMQYETISFWYSQHILVRVYTSNKSNKQEIALRRGATGSWMFFSVLKQRHTNMVQRVTDLDVFFGRTETE